MGLQIERERGRECDGSRVHGRTVADVVEFDFAASNAGQCEGIKFTLNAWFIGELGRQEYRIPRECEGFFC